MPICKNCKKRIDRFNKDRCPICGVEKPFEGMSSDTVEITTNIDVDSVGSDYHPCNKKKILMLFCLCGLTGIPFFYIHKKVLGFIEIACSLSIIVLISLLLWHFTAIPSAVCGLIGIATVYVINIVIGLVFYNTPNLKDGNGEFII